MLDVASDEGNGRFDAPTAEVTSNAASRTNAGPLLTL
jgi:hypothetical protein